MNLPHANNAYVEERKIKAYLLSFTHPKGRDKARFFSGFGFRASEWEVFGEALIEHAQRHNAVEEGPTPDGLKYAIIGRIETPDGRNPDRVKTVWEIRHGSDQPRLVTALPIHRMNKGETSDVQRA